MKYEKGQIVEHKLDKEWLMVLEDKGETIVCRTKSYDVIEFNDFELAER